MFISPLNLAGTASKAKLTSLQRKAFRQSLNLYLTSEIYNSIINTIINYQSNFRLNPLPKITFLINDDEYTLYEFFKEFRKALILYGICILRKENKNTYEYVSPILLNINSPFTFDEEGTIRQINFEFGEEPIDEYVIFTNNPVAGVNVFLPEFYFIFDEVERIEQFKASILTKRTIVSNIALQLKMQAPQEGIFLGKTLDEMEKIQSQVQTMINTSQIRPGSIISTVPDTSIDIVQPINSEYDEHYIYKRLCEIASAVNVPAFLITGDLKELNYAAARSALQDFVVFSNREITRLTWQFMRKLGFTARVTLPPPTTISTAESINYFNFMNQLSQDERYNFSVDEIKEKLKLGGLL